MIGSGVIRHGITIAYALGGYDVNMADATREILGRALNRISADFTGLVRNGLVTEEGAKSALARIRTTASIADAVAGCKLVTQAITEQIVSRKELFKELDQLCPEDVVLKSPY